MFCPGLGTCNPAGDQWPVAPDGGARRSTGAEGGGGSGAARTERRLMGARQGRGGRV